MCETKNRIKIAWEVFGMAVLAAIIITVIIFLLAPHQITDYYLSGDVNNGMATCIYADITWLPDQKCYCTNNPQQAIEDLKVLNAK